MRTLLIKAPYRDLYGPLKLASGNYFLLGLGYIASFLRQHGHTVAILDPEAEGLEYSSLINRIREFNPGLVGISATTPDFASAFKITELIRKHIKTFILLGGIHASSLPEYILQTYPGAFDALCIGEGEHTALEVCSFLEGKVRALSDIRGICFRDGEKIVRTPPRPFIEDVDSLPFPARDLVDLNLYQPHAINFRKGRTATIITSRGCPFRCTFCASKLTLGGKFRARSPEKVVAEIRHLAERYGINHILIQDDTFTFDMDRAKETCRRIIDSRLKVEWFAFSQVSRVDEELISLMKQAGCYSIGFGIESADEQVLKNIRKPITMEQCTFAVDTARKHGLKTQAFFIFGNKGDTSETVNKTIKFACSLSPTFALFNKLIPYPGTEIFRDYFKEDYKNIDWKNFVPYGVNAACGTEHFNKRDLELLAFRANLVFYFRPMQLFRIFKTIRSFHEFKQYVKGAMGLILQLFSWKKVRQKSGEKKE